MSVIEDAHTLYWLPELADWSDRVSALTRDDTDWTALVRLAGYRLDFLRTARIDRLTLELTRRAASPLPVLRILALSTSSIDHLFPAIRVAFLRRGYSCDIRTADYGALDDGLDDPALVDFAPDMVVLAHDAIALTRGIAPTDTTSAVDGAVQRTIADLATLWGRIEQRFAAPVLQQIPFPPSPRLLGANEHRLAGAEASILRLFGQQVRVVADAAGVDMLALDDQAQRDGIARWHDPVLWHRAKQFVTPRAGPLYGELVARALIARRGASPKCLVLDLDNTLWGGVVGDDGIANLEIGQGSAAGEAFLAFQNYVLALSERGVILAVCSKNDETNAREPFEKLPDMALRLSDIACFVANWNSKADNLRIIAKALDIGLDSLVFVDDNPFERNLVREYCPEVHVPEVGDDPALFAQCLSDAGYFEAVAITDEDRTRKTAYRANSERAALASVSGSTESYLAGLKMILRWGRIDATDMKRAAQLIGKTNQFNLTTIRHSEPELAAMMADPDIVCLRFRLSDRFGDNGLIAVVIARRTSDGILDIDTWLMSCRVLRRSVEKATLVVIADIARELKCATIRGRYISTPKNQIVAGLYADLGFFALHQDNAGSTTWQIAVDAIAPTCDPIMLERID